MKKTIATLMLSGVVVFAGVTPAVASTYPAPGNEQGTVSDGNIDRGETITFSGTGYFPGETVNVTFEKKGGPKGSAPANFSVAADSKGSISTSITFENAGQYEIVATGATSGNVRSARVGVNNGNHGRGNNGNGKGGTNLVSVSSVTDAGTAAAPTNTAAEPGLVAWGLVGASVLAAGTASVVVARRRSSINASKQ
ncbi:MULTISPECIES: neocarzinostatin apoprotein domain-containing protein [Paenarthrobacter]|uniref:neocarzinostatin apoprotein domain-containing protein n=1 Tax=Paenarthrobacter TaxID=1742992 RepID=UPI00236621CD|nr:neocarzinostatin apoprotein domain-containing protein [Paenarthrobacter sp. AB444]MDD7833779.1 neocarzinostatin apoprotein domain-containing protein [Paenarthrobacter sp. AB444]